MNDYYLGIFLAFNLEIIPCLSAGVWAQPYLTGLSAVAQFEPGSSNKAQK